MCKVLGGTSSVGDRGKGGDSDMNNYNYRTGTTIVIILPCSTVSHNPHPCPSLPLLPSQRHAFIHTVLQAVLPKQHCRGDVRVEALRLAEQTQFVLEEAVDQPTVQ